MSSSSYIALTEEPETPNPLYEINQQRWSRCSDFTAQQVALAIITLLCASVVLAHLCGAIPYDYIAIAAGALFCVTLFLDILLCMRNLPTIDPFS